MLVEETFDRFTETRLIVLDCQNEVATSIDNGLRDLLLTSQSINRDDHVVQSDLLQKLGNRREFIRFLFGCDLPQRDAFFRGPCDDNMEWTKIFRKVV